VTERGAEAIPKRHHYVPQWHLRRFAADGRRPGVWRYSKSADAYQYMAVKNAAVITHYYSGPGEDGPDTSLEEALATLDGQGAYIVGKVENGDILDAEEALVLAAYTTMLHGRVPPARGGQEKVLETFGALQVEMALANADEVGREEILTGAKEDGLAEPHEDFDQFADRLIGELRRGDSKVVHHPLATMGAAGIGVVHAAPIVAEMLRMLIEAPPGLEFVISDNPVSLYSPATPSFMGAGYLTEDVEVTLPLDRRRLLLFSHVEWFQGHCCVTAPAVDHFNSRTWLAAGDYVFASSKEALERVAGLFEPEVRRRPGGGVEISGYP
jgi:hypothetical protein